MTFIQVIDCTTRRADELDRLMDQWVEATEGTRTATHAVVGRDRADSSHVVEIVEFPSYAEAMRNSGLPETDRIFREMVALCETEPTFTDLDIVRDDQLNKAVARRCFELMSRAEVDAVFAMCAPGYIEHDPANSADPADLARARKDTEPFISAMHPRFTIESQVAEGDLVCTRWTAVGRHTGPELGVQPTGRTVTITGQTCQRFEGGKIAEAWFNWDLAGLMSQLGLAGGEVPGG
jgi:hypothetical protein